MVGCCREKGSKLFGSDGLVLSCLIKEPLLVLDKSVLLEGAADIAV